ncbi:MAG: 30S ribosomal protein S17 [Planctomycetes bacterium]|nr:30S ribosomal protein S17 [Planctomycetota bacterium]MCB9910372.1 30S ribosomal protein S17 [Planctomycetota bacterium]MCB9912017.1 30S ribosomal protein S17 [Planctomycetota bacterium]HPF14237.1 30S ribosomal protein S17 [Planctomycetota bacterium]HRV80557.1 30S ribosomal protein S17 [Planctomycetota bacterium]
MSDQQQQASDERNARRIITGVVSSDKMDQTIAVVVERMLKHPKYGKYLRRHSKVYAHDPKNEAHMGDTVEIMECRPMSKLKRYRLIQVTNKAVLPMGEIQ